MIPYSKETVMQYLNAPIFSHIQQVADKLGMPCYVVGGYVRDIFLERPSKDIDVVVVGSGIEIATALAKHLRQAIKITSIKNYGLSQTILHTHAPRM